MTYTWITFVLPLNMDNMVHNACLSTAAKATDYITTGFNANKVFTY